MLEQPHFIAVLKKPYVFVPILSILLVLAGFLIVILLANPADIVSSSGGIKYENPELGFSMLLPGSFEYFQTQRINGENYTDIEIFVPTADRAYAQEVPGYGKAIVIRSFSRPYWDSLDQNSQERADYIYQGLVNDRAICIKFWQNIPADWESKWSEETRDFIIKNFNLL